MCNVLLLKFSDTRWWFSSTRDLDSQASIYNKRKSLIIMYIFCDFKNLYLKFKELLWNKRCKHGWLVLFLYYKFWLCRLPNCTRHGLIACNNIIFRFSIPFLGIHQFLKRNSIKCGIRYWIDNKKDSIIRQPCKKQGYLTWIAIRV